MATRTKQTKSDAVKPSNVYANVASAKGIDTQRAGKLVRSFIRRHDSDLRETFAWPPKTKGHADGNRYTDMPKECADHIVARLSGKSDSK
jgi:hypothetical protein